MSLISAGFYLYLQVLQDDPEQDAHPLPDDLIRSDPPPIPNDEKSFRTSAVPQAGQMTSFSRPRRTSCSKDFRHEAQQNS
jgi:hypothetical protein